MSEWTLHIRNRATAIELLRCAVVRASWYESRRKPVPQVTLEAIRLLTEALKR